jgi:adenylate cyclase
MAHLSLTLLGTFEAAIDGQPLTGFKSNKERALLVYLAVEADRPHRRELLAGLLWPDWPDREALNNLRYALSNLRRVIGDPAADPPYLIVTRNTLQFNAGSDSRVDVAAFLAGIGAAGERNGAGGLRLHRAPLSMPPAAGPPRRPDEAALPLDEAVALYRGSFLEGFSVSDSAAFEEWQVFTRERLAREAGGALRRLAAGCEASGDFAGAQLWAWRQLELEPWDEGAHRQVMRALALGGRRSEALAQYERCRKSLAAELGVEPDAETTWLYQQIRDGKPVRSEAPSQQPAPPAKGTPAGAPPIPSPRPPPGPAPSPDLGRDAPLAVEWRPARPAGLPGLPGEDPERQEPVTFVAREPELARLDGFLAQALAGRGRVAFVTGDVGSGKSVLLQEFARHAQATHAELVVAGGQCNAYSGIGDPYLPFREILGLLAGDVAARWAVGAISGERARRLWDLVPLTAGAVAEFGPDLVGTFLPRAWLLERASSREPGRPGWLTRLEGLAEHAGPEAAAPGSRQADLFEQFTRVVQELARHRPMVLMLDDLQWSDPGSISLLFHLGRRLAGSRILIVGAYRAEEVALGRDGQRHPLEPVVHELQRDFGDLNLDLGQADGRRFMEAFLDSEPNRLPGDFRDLLYRQTGGHPLFTIELLRGLQERGDLLRDAAGAWVEGPALDWEALPARVEAVIAERVGRLNPALHEALRVASVEGELFTAEVVARVLGTEEHTVLGDLSRELDARHRLVRAERIERIGGVLLSHYRFRHILFQRYLYGSLDAVERAHLHEQVGATLERLYGGEEAASAIAVQLAVHFQRASNTEKAIGYLRQAGDRALRLSAYEEAEAHFARALDLLLALPDLAARRHQELALRVSLAMSSRQVIPGGNREGHLRRAAELGRQTGDTAQLCRVLGEFAIIHYVRAEHHAAFALAGEAFELASGAGDPVLLTTSRWLKGFMAFGLGDFRGARADLEHVIASYQPDLHHQTLVRVQGSDAGVGALAYQACCLWCLGYPEQAMVCSRKALELAERFGHVFTLADVLCFAGCVFSEMRRDAAALEHYGSELGRISDGMGLISFGEYGDSYAAEALCRLGNPAEGIARLTSRLEILRADDSQCYRSGLLGGLAAAQGRAGEPEAGLAIVDEALAFVEKSGERYYEAELRRIKGELLEASGDDEGAEAAYGCAVAVARRQEARSWELRAATSLARLWARQGKRAEARRLVSDVYGWFTEGFDTPDLIEARDLLQRLP